MIIWKASRGFGGKTVMLSALACVESITLGASVTVLGGSAEQSERVHAYMLGDHDNFPDAFWNSPLLAYFGDDIQKRSSTARRTRLKHGGRINALTASQKSVRGPHPQRLRGDEIDEMDQAIWDAAKGQPMTMRGIDEQTVGSSTHQYPDKTMATEMALALERGHPIYSWCYKESLESQLCGWLPQSTVDRKKAVLANAAWLAEVELQEPSPENRALESGSVIKMFDTARFVEQAGIKALPSRIPGALGAKLIFEDPHVPEDDAVDEDGAQLKPGHYAIGADWGKAVDKTIIIVWAHRRPADAHGCILPSRQAAVAHHDQSVPEARTALRRRESGARVRRARRDGSGRCDPRSSRHCRVRHQDGGYRAEGAVRRLHHRRGGESASLPTRGVYVRRAQVHDRRRPLRPRPSAGFVRGRRHRVLRGHPGIRSADALIPVS